MKNTFLLLCMFLTSCTLLMPPCTLVAHTGINVLAVDARTGEEITEGLAGVIRDGSYVEKLSVSGHRLSGAWQYAGTYEVKITAPGYTSWVQEGVKVKKKRCSFVSPVNLTARLRRG